MRYLFCSRNRTTFCHPIRKATRISVPVDSMKLLTVSGAGRRDNPLIKARSAVDLFTYEMAGVARRERGGRGNKNSFDLT